MVNRFKSSFSQYFTAIQILFGVLLFYLYYQNNYIAVLTNFHGNDFAHNYLAGYILQDGGNPYEREQLLEAARLFSIERVNPYVYPIFVGLLFIPLSYLRYSDAQWIWLLCNHLMLFSIIGLVVYSHPKILRFLAGLTFLALYIFYHPYIRTLTAGQLNILILFLLVGIWYFWLKNNPIGAGICLGIVTLIKLFPGLFILYFFLRKEYKIVGISLITILLLFFISLFWMDFQTQLDYLQIIKSMSYGQSVWQEYNLAFHVEPANQSIHALLIRLFSENPVSRPWSNKPVLALSLSIIFILILLIYLVILGIRSGNQKNDNHAKSIEFSIIFLLSILIPSLLWDHYLVYLPFILMIILLHHADRKILTSGKIVYLVLLYIWFAIPFNYWNPAYRQGIGILFSSIKFYPVLLLLLYLIVIQKKDYKNSINIKT